MKLATLVLTAILLAGCSSSPKISSRSDFNPAYFVGAWSTFTWVGETANATGQASDPSISPLVHKRIQDSIGTALFAKGYRYVADKNAADFAVGYSVGMRDKVDIQTWPSSYYRGYYGRGWGRSYYGYGTTTEVTARSYTEGVLAIDIFAVKTSEPAWHGWSSRKVNSKTAGSAPEVAEVVNATLADLPPKQ